jgi:hypothetical protein
MKRFTIALLFLSSLCGAQKTQESGPGWTAQQLEWWNTPNDLVQALKAINEKPKQASERVSINLPCGGIFVYTPGTKDSKGNEVLMNVRSTFDGQKPEKVAFCWLNEVRRRFAAEEIEAKDHPSLAAFVTNVQLALLTEPDSPYLKLVNVYCSNGGTFYTSLTGTVLECPSAKGK